MIAAALLLVAAAPSQSAVDAERTFAAMAGTEGQWTAFRAFAAPKAIMFVPAEVNAQRWLQARADPPVSVVWWPGRSWTSCDDSLAVNSGPWLREGGKRTGTFTTVWRRQADGGWKWLLDHGRDTPRAVSSGDRPILRAPVCRALDKAAKAAERPSPAPDAAHLLVQRDGEMPSGRAAPETADLPAGKGGRSDDGTLVWALRPLKGSGGAHSLSVYQWDGRRHRRVLHEVTGETAQ